MASMRHLFPWLLIAAFALTLTACATPGAEEERVEDPGEMTDEERAQAREEQRRGAEARGVGDRAALSGEDLRDALEDPDSPINKRIVYFAFDSSVIRDEDMSILKAHGDFLADHPGQRITIEGHTDERGAREYNLALGQRRAQAVKRILVLNGATDDQLEVVSYGEESPVNSASNEDAYAENRRAELVYTR